MKQGEEERPPPSRPIAQAQSSDYTVMSESMSHRRTMLGQNTRKVLRETEKLKLTNLVLLDVWLLFKISLFFSNKILLFLPGLFRMRDTFLFLYRQAATASASGHARATTSTTR